MSNSTRWYATREAVKAASIDGAALDNQIDTYIEASSEDIEKMLNDRRFIPYLSTKGFGKNDWSTRGGGRQLEVPDLLVVTSIEVDSTPLTTDDYLLYPRNAPDIGEPYTAIIGELGGSHPVWISIENVEIEGLWGYSGDTRAAGALAGDVADSDTTIPVSDASLIGVGDTLKIEDESLFVSGRVPLDTGATVAADITDAESAGLLALDDGTKVHAGERVLVDGEWMVVVTIAGNNAVVRRSIDGSTLAAHSIGAVVYAERTLTVVRGVNGTVAAAHADDVLIDAYAPPADIVNYCKAQAIAYHQQARAGWTGIIGGGESAIELRGVGLSKMRQDIQDKYGGKGSF